MALRLSIGPADLPITLPELKDHLHLTEDDADQDATIMGYLRAVVSYLDGAEGVLGRALVTQTWIMTLDMFPRFYSTIRLPLWPAQSITSIAYIDSDGVTQTWAASKYKLLNANTPSRPARIERAFGEVWPTTRDESEAVTITWVAGYGLRNAVPHQIRHMIMILVADAFRHPESFDVGPAIAERPNLKALMASVSVFEAA